MANLPVLITRPHGGRTVMTVNTVIETSDITGSLDIGGLRHMKHVMAQGVGIWTGALSVALEYSIEDTPVNWYPLLDDAGTPAAIIFTGNSRFVSDRPVRHLRLVRSSGTTGADADFIIQAFHERNN